jgi:hypothetical protein
LRKGQVVAPLIPSEQIACMSQTSSRFEAGAQSGKLRRYMMGV